MELRQFPQIFTISYQTSLLYNLFLSTDVCSPVLLISCPQSPLWALMWGGKVIYNQPAMSRGVFRPSEPQFPHLQMEIRILTLKPVGELEEMILGPAHDRGAIAEQQWQQWEMVQQDAWENVCGPIICMIIPALLFVM